MAVNSAGTVVYFSDANERIRTISGGTVSTLAGSGVTGHRDGVASQARFAGPGGLALDGTNVSTLDDVALARAYVRRGWRLRFVDCADLLALQCHRPT